MSTTDSPKPLCDAHVTSPIGSGDALNAETTAVEKLAGGEPPITKAPVEQIPVEQTAVEHAPVEQAPVEQTAVDQAPVEQTAVEQTAVETASVEDPNAVKACPQCGSTASKGMMSWCPDCGYYPEIDKYRVEEIEEEEVPEEPTGRRWTWLHTLNTGLVLILLLTCAGRMLYNFYDADPAIWTLVQFGWGVMLALCAHVSAGIFAMKQSDSHGPVSWFANPIETWGPAVSENVFQKKFTGLVWGVVLAVAPWFLVGGVTMEHIFPPAKKKKPSANLVKEIAGAASGVTDGQRAGSNEGAVENFVGDVEQEAVVDQRNKEHVCYIYGYMTEGSDKVRRVLVATRVENRLEHFAVLTEEQLGPSRINALSRILPEIRQQKSSAATSYFAKWVNPTKGILLESDGVDAIGKPVNLRLRKRKTEQPKASDG